jgi:hypothetical protein
MHAQPRNYLVNSWLTVFVCFVLIAFFFARMFAIQPLRRLHGRDIALVSFRMSIFRQHPRAA